MIYKSGENACEGKKKLTLKPGCLSVPKFQMLWSFKYKDLR